MHRKGWRHSINFYRDDNFLVRITYELSNHCRELCKRKKTAQ